MNILFPIYLFILSSAALADETEQFLKKYHFFQPYYDSIREPMPVKRCENSSIKHGRKNQERCWMEIEYEHHPQKLQNLLAETETHFETSDPKFLSSSLGKEYKHLKHFMNIYNKMKNCKEGRILEEPDAVSMINRFEEGASEAVSFSNCESCHSKRNQIKQTFSAVLQQTQNSPTAESNLQNEILSQALEKSIKARILMESRLKEDNLKKSFFASSAMRLFCRPNNGVKNICSEQETELLRKIIEKERTKSLASSTAKPLTLEDTTKYLNRHISRLNNILREYNTSRKMILEEKQKESAKLSSHIANRPALHKIKEKYTTALKRLKNSSFREYQETLAQIYSTELGAVLRTKSIHSAAGFLELEKMNSKLLGIQGFEETILTNKDAFPLLKPIEDKLTRTALSEYFSRSNASIHSLLSQKQQKQKEDEEYHSRLQTAAGNREKKKLADQYKSKRIRDIEELLQVHPDIVSLSIVKTPQHSSIICTAVKNISDRRKRQNFIKDSITISSAVGSAAVAVIAPYLGVVGLPVLLASSGVAVTSAVADYTLRYKGASQHRELKEKMLNAYLSQTGDNQSIDDIRQEWRLALAEDLHAKWAVGFGLFDLTRTGWAMRQTLVHTTKKIRNTTAVQITKNRILLNNISQNKAYETALLNLLDTHSQLEVRNFLRAAALFPPKKQALVLKELPNMAAHPRLNLRQITAELKKHGTKANVMDFLIRYTRCVNCKAKPGIKLKKGKHSPSTD